MKKIKIRDLSVVVEHVVETKFDPENLSPFFKGLGDRDSLERDRGMLFEYHEPKEMYMWMLNMRFDLDVIWLDENLNIVGITEDIKVDSYPEEFHSPGKIKYFLEINAGMSKEFGISVGDTAEVSEVS